MKYLLLNILFILISCSSLIQETNISKIKPYSFKLEEEWNIAPPYVLEFSNNSKKLWYIGVSHTNKSDSDTFKLINKFFTIYKPDIVIVEGIETKEINNKKIFDLVKTKCTKSKLMENESSCSENLYAALKAQIFNIPIIGGEPADEELLKIIKEDGYNEEDFINFWFSSILPQLYREGKLTSYNQIENCYLNFIKSFPLSNKYENLDHYNYKTWLEYNIPALEFNQLIDANLSAPIKEGNYLQRLSAIIGIARDKHIVETIFNSLNQYNRVLILYGHSHVLTQLPALEAYLGKYRILNVNYK